jgi:hypothetical protein
MRRLQWGVAVKLEQLEQDEAYRAWVLAQTHLLVPGVALKWDTYNRNHGAWTFQRAIACSKSHDDHSLASLGIGLRPAG